MFQESAAALLGVSVPSKNKSNDSTMGSASEGGSVWFPAAPADVAAAAEVASVQVAPAAEVVPVEVAPAAEVALVEVAPAAQVAPAEVALAAEVAPAEVAPAAAASPYPTGHGWPWGWKPKLTGHKYKSAEKVYGASSDGGPTLGYPNSFLFRSGAATLDALWEDVPIVPPTKSIPPRPSGKSKIGVQIGDLIWGGKKLAPKEFELCVLINGAEIRLRKFERKEFEDLHAARSDPNPQSPSSPMLEDHGDKRLHFNFGVSQDAIMQRVGLSQTVKWPEWIIRLRTESPVSASDPAATDWHWLLRFPTSFFSDTKNADSFLESRSSGTFLVPMVDTKVLDMMYESHHGRKRDRSESKGGFPIDSFSAKQWERTMLTLAERPTGTDGGLESVKMEVSLQRSGEN